MRIGHLLHCRAIKVFLAHRIGISEILPWDGKSYLTHVVLPRLSRIGCALVVMVHTHMVVKIQIFYVKVTSSYHVASQRMQGLLGAF